MIEKMRISIIAAMDKELSLLLALMPDHKVDVVEGQEIYEGKIGPHEVSLSRCGIGKVNSAINAYRVIRHFSPELVINSGVAGGADPTVRIGTVLIADGVCYHDVWCGPGTVAGEADGFPLYMEPYKEGMNVAAMLKQTHPEILIGKIASGDRFISRADEVARIREVCPEARACDMESASIAQTCMMEKVPFMVVRVVSDTPGAGDNLDQYRNFWTDAPKRTFAVLEELLSRMC